MGPCNFRNRNVQMFQIPKIWCHHRIPGYRLTRKQGLEQRLTEPLPWLTRCLLWACWVNTIDFFSMVHRVWRIFPQVDASWVKVKARSYLHEAIVWTFCWRIQAIWRRSEITNKKAWMRDYQSDWKWMRVQNVITILLFTW